MGVLWARSQTLKHSSGMDKAVKPRGLGCRGSTPEEAGLSLGWRSSGVGTKEATAASRCSLPHVSLNAKVLRGGGGSVQQVSSRSSCTLPGEVQLLRHVLQAPSEH